ncbi:Uncharacterized protein TCM_043645 [Theobroma cacao]|uniref:CCHC-type domain-containing protein n=1 Tax=Theobroma cacao TaxID=3641 RepID=A0A061FW22_THECC|nr:Uncharacterized protein TCM_043645 [Theobroma cacao]
MTSSNSRQMCQSSPYCVRCGTMHVGPCAQSYDVCFNCGQPGHMRRDSPYEGRSQGTCHGYVQLASAVASAISPLARRSRVDKGKGITSIQSRPTESVP